MRDRFIKIVAELLDEDPLTALLLADISVPQFETVGVFTRHPHRVLNVGIREQAQVGIAAGFALEGFRPFVHTYASFLTQRAFEQLKLDLSHQQAGAVLVSVGASYDASGAGRSHHAPEDVLMISSLPGWRVHVPGHADEVEMLLRGAAQRKGCEYIRLSEASNSAAVPMSEGSCVVLRQGSSTAGVVLAVGPLLDPVLEATKALDMTLIYTLTPYPLDVMPLRKSLRALNPKLVIVEPYLEGSSISQITQAMRDVPVQILSLGVKKGELRRYGTRQEHDRAHGLDPASLSASIASFFE